MEKVGTSLPVLTKIAICWMVVLGVVGTIVGLIWSFNGLKDCESATGEFGQLCVGLGFIFMLLVFIAGFFYLLSAVLFVFKVKWVWIVAITILLLHFSSFLP